MTVLADTPVLKTARLTLRAPIAADWPAYHAFALTDRARYVRPPDITPERAWRSFSAMVGHWVLRGWGSFVMCRQDDAHPVGMVGPWFPEGWPEPEILWMIWDPAAEGKGLVREAAQATLDHVFDNLGWDTAVSYIDPTNVASIRLAERLGATHDPLAATPRLDESPKIRAYRHMKGKPAA